MGEKHPISVPPSFHQAVDLIKKYHHDYNQTTFGLVCTGLVLGIMEDVKTNLLFSEQQMEEIAPIIALSGIRIREPEITEVREGFALMCEYFKTRFEDTMFDEETAGHINWFLGEMARHLPFDEGNN